MKLSGLIRKLFKKTESFIQTDKFLLPGHKICRNDGYLYNERVEQSFMKSRITSSFVLICIVVMMVFISVNNVSAKIVTYPATPGLTTSTDFTVTVNNTPVWVERVSSKLDTFSYKLYSGRAMEDLNVANFSCSGSLTIKITASTNIDSYIIRPVSYTHLTLPKNRE